jgi:hypothetical protein
MIPNPDYGQPPPGGMVYTPEQTADLCAASRAERMSYALLAYARSLRLAAGTVATRHPDHRRACRADARAALHLHPELLAILEGEAP